MRWIFLIATLFVESSAHAFFLESNLFYTNDALTQTSATTANRMFYDVAIGFNIDKKGFYQAGWAYDGFATSDAAGSSTTTYSATAMGPKFNFFFGKQRQWNLGLTYGIVSKATYSVSGSNAEVWSGTSYKAELGYIMRSDDGAFFFGVKINYVSASYTERIIGSTNYSTISYNRTFLYPTLTFGFDFN